MASFIGGEAFAKVTSIQFAVGGFGSRTNVEVYTCPVGRYAIVYPRSSQNVSNTISIRSNQGGGGDASRTLVSGGGTDFATFLEGNINSGYLSPNDRLVITAGAPSVPGTFYTYVDVFEYNIPDFETTNP
jgi:hypothetical protein